MKQPIDLVMFDLDGTLADTGPDLADAVNHTRAHFDLPPLPDTLVYSHVGRGVEHLLRHSLPEGGAERFPEVMRVFLVCYERHLLDKTVLYPNVRETLAYFQRHKRIVITNKLQRLALAIVHGLGVESCFDAVIGGDSGAEKKPHPGPLNSALARFQISASRALMVGDSDIDIEAGKSAGVITCGVTYGLGDRNQLVAARPDFLVDTIAELRRYFY